MTLLSTVSASEARDAVNRIVQHNGFVRESTLEKVTREARREVEEALLAKDKKIGASVLTYVSLQVHDSSATDNIRQPGKEPLHQQRSFCL